MDCLQVNGMAEEWNASFREHYPSCNVPDDVMFGWFMAAIVRATAPTGDQIAASEPAVPPAAVIAALESDREALRRVVDGLAARLLVAEAAKASPAAPVVAIEPPDPLVWARAAHPWRRDPKASWRMGL